MLKRGVQEHQLVLGGSNMTVKRVVWHIHADGSIPKNDLFKLASRVRRERGEELLKPEVYRDGQRVPYSSRAERLINNPHELERILFDLRKYNLPDIFAYATGSMQDKKSILEAMAAYHCYLASD